MFYVCAYVYIYIICSICNVWIWCLFCYRSCSFSFPPKPTIVGMGKHGKPGRCGLRNHWTYWPPVLDVNKRYRMVRLICFLAKNTRFFQFAWDFERWAACWKMPFHSFFVSFWSYIGLHADTSPRSATYQTSLNTYFQWQHIKPRMTMKNRHLGIM